MGRIVCLLLILAPLAFLQTRTARGKAETPVPSDPPFGEVKGAFFALSVADLEASAKWYREKLDLGVNMCSKSGKASVIVLSGNGLTVELIRQDDAMDLGEDALHTHGFFKAGLVVENLDKTLAALKARNVQIAYGPYPARVDSTSNFIIKDNAGNLVQFFSK